MRVIKLDLHDDDVRNYCFDCNWFFYLFFWDDLCFICVLMLNYFALLSKTYQHYILYCTYKYFKLNKNNYLQLLSIPVLGGSRQYRHRPHLTRTSDGRTAFTGWPIQSACLSITIRNPWTRPSMVHEPSNPGRVHHGSPLD